MSALMELETEVIDINRPRTRTQSRTVARRPSQVRVRTKRRTATSAFSNLIGHATALALVGFLLYCASALGGHVVLEQARRDGLRAAERVKRSNQELARLSDRVNRLKSLREIDRWAVARNLTRSVDGAAPSIPEGTRVALR